MSNRQGRKKHLVNGDVSKIKRSEEGLGIGQVGEKDNFLSRLWRIVRREEKDKTDGRE